MQMMIKLLESIFTFHTEYLSTDLQDSNVISYLT